MTMFGRNPNLHNSVRSPLQQGDCPELDISELLDSEDTQKYQSLIGSLKWDISLGVFDILTHVMTISSFIYATRQCRTDQMKRIYAYMDKKKECVH